MMAVPEGQHPLLSHQTIEAALEERGMPPPVNNNNDKMLLAAPEFP